MLETVLIDQLCRCCVNFFIRCLDFTWFTLLCIVCLVMQLYANMLALASLGCVHCVSLILNCLMKCDVCFVIS